MKKHPDPELLDDENPEWKDVNFARARPASEVLPELFGAQVARAMLKPRGKQVAPTKQAVTVRYSPDVIAAFKATGSGWQARMNDALRDWLRTHSPV